MPLQEALKQLFLVDQQLRGLESRLDGARTHVRAQQIKISQLTQQLNALAEQLKRERATEANLENDARSMDERITALRDRMNSAKTNKEYSAMLVEVNTLKVEKGKVEEDALEHMAQIEQLASEVAEVEAKLAEQERIKAHAEKELAERTEEVADQLEQLKEKRRQAASEVPTDALAVFDKLADSLDGEAMAPIEQEDPRRMEYTCGGCYMAIPVEKVNQLHAGDKVVRCTSCTRILYLSDSLRDTLASK